MLLDILNGLDAQIKIIKSTIILFCIQKLKCLIKFIYCDATFVLCGKTNYKLKYHQQQINQFAEVLAFAVVSFAITIMGSRDQTWWRWGGGGRGGEGMIR